MECHKCPNNIESNPKYRRMKFANTPCSNCPYEDAALTINNRYAKPYNDDIAVERIETIEEVEQVEEIEGDKIVNAVMRICKDSLDRKIVKAILNAEYTLSYTEISRLCNCSDNTVRRRLESMRCRILPIR